MASKSKTKLFSSGQLFVILCPAFQLFLQKAAGKMMQAEEETEEARYHMICMNAVTSHF